MGGGAVGLCQLEGVAGSTIPGEGGSCRGSVQAGAKVTGLIRSKVNGTTYLTEGGGMRKEESTCLKSSEGRQENKI
ncbi:hypothetical protein PBY51_009353 [Eleginops maclovinus]|uniref:Uncharacterized protein n=1 Tax=Eleginops maclovinus TaxID=56733 RepID=A0AAN7XWS5_ELEMC|nr:hypothetical protein PBY51_009353 [Eleginops maclovinus]